MLKALKERKWAKNFSSFPKIIIDKSKKKEENYERFLKSAQKMKKSDWRRLEKFLLHQVLKNFLRNNASCQV